MVDLLNGVDCGPIPGYVFAFANGLILVGLLTGRTLSPVYEFKAGMQPARDGSVNIQHAAFPLMLLGSLDSIDLPEGCITIPLAQLSRAERASVAVAVQNGEKMAQGIRAAAAGVQLAPASALRDIKR